ncbi:MAG: hypothetical protein ACPIOQ_11600 [Promethearchaeia archaeon]
MGRLREALREEKAKARDSTRSHKKTGDVLQRQLAQSSAALASAEAKVDQLETEAKKSSAVHKAAVRQSKRDSSTIALHTSTSTSLSHSYAHLPPTCVLLGCAERSRPKEGCISVLVSASSCIPCMPGRTSEPHSKVHRSWLSSARMYMC